MTDNQTQKDRIKLYARSLNMSMRKFEGACNLSNGYISSMRKGVGHKAIEQISANFPDLNTGWLLTGEGEMLKTDVPPQTATDQTVSEVRLLAIIDEQLHTIKQQREQISELNAYIRNSKGDIIGDETTIKHYTLPSEPKQIEQSLPVFAYPQDVSFFENSGKPIDTISIPRMSKCDGAFFMQGNSMAPILKGGDIVLYKTLNNAGKSINFLFGDMYLVSFKLECDEHIVVRTIHQGETDEFVKLVCDNENLPAKEIPLASISAMARIKSSIRYHVMS